MKKYILFCGEYGTESHGWVDFVGDFDTIEEAMEKICFDWYQIVDTETKRIVKN